MEFEERLRKKSIYVADFETTTNSFSSEKTQVWLFYAEHLFEEERNFIGVSIQDFFGNFVDKLKKSTTIYFHNLNFDGEFILNYLCDVSNYRTPPKNRKYKIKMNKNEFTNMSDGPSQHYEIDYVNLQGVHIHFKDSYKVLQSSVSQLQGKGDKERIDYDIKEVPKSYKEITREQEIYVKNDVKVVIEKLKHFLLRLETSSSLTAAGSARKNLKEFIGFEKWDKLFNNKISVGHLNSFGQLVEGEWDYYRKFYVGGYCLNNPDYLGKLVECKNDEQIMVLDFNSLYPSIMFFENLPYGYPIKNCNCNGKEHPLQLLEMKLTATIKDGRIPFIPDTANSINIKWLTKVHNETMYFTNAYWEEVKKGYNVEDYKIIKTTCFNAMSDIFHDFVSYWMEQKTKAKIEGNKAEYLLDKLMPNSSYGKFGMDYCRKKMFLRKVEDGEIIRKGTALYGSHGQYIWDYEFSIAEGEYIPMALWITSLAKLWTVRAIETIQKIGGLFLNSDTDSVHFKIKKEDWEKGKRLLNVHTTNLGALDLEGIYKYHMCWGRKRYIEFDKINSKERNMGFAGVSERLVSKYTNLDFVEGRVKFKTISKKKVQGGVVLQEIEKRIENYVYQENNL